MFLFVRTPTEMSRLMTKRNDCAPSEDSDQPGHPPSLIRVFAVRMKKAWMPIWNSQNCNMFPLAFDAGWLQGHWWGFISRNYVVWPTFLMNVFIALKGSHFWFLFDFTAAGVVPCGGRKTSPRTSTIVQFIFYFGPLRSAIIFWEIRNKWLG